MTKRGRSGGERGIGDRLAPFCHALLLDPLRRAYQLITAGMQARLSRPAQDEEGLWQRFLHF